MSGLRAWAHLFLFCLPELSIAIRGLRGNTQFLWFGDAETRLPEPITVPSLLTV